MALRFQLWVNNGAEGQELVSDEGAYKGYLQDGGMMYLGDTDYYASKNVFTISLNPNPVPDYTAGTSSTDICTCTTNATNPSFEWTCLIDGVLNSDVTAQIKGANTATMSLTYDFTSLHEHCVFRCTVTDSSGNSRYADASFSIVAPATAKIESATSSLATTRYTTGSPVNDQLTVIPVPADDGTYLYSYSIDSTLFNISDTGLIEGLATTNGTYTASCTVIDLYDNQVTTSSSFVVAQENSHLESVSLSPSSLSVLETDNINQTFTLTPSPADDGTYSYSYSFSGDSKGLSITNNNDGTFKLTGTPNAAGDVVINFSCTDSYSVSRSSNATITITVPASKLQSATATIANNTATVGTAYTGSMEVDTVPEDDGTYSYAYALNGPNYGLSIDSTGAITGTPTTAGTAGFKVSVTDSYKTTVTAYANVSVSAAGNPAGTLIPANCSLEQLDPYTAKKAGKVDCTVTVDGDDDGTYQYYWYANGNGTGFGYVYTTSGSDITSKWVTGASTVQIGGTSYNKAGTAYYSVKVKDTHGNEFDSKQLSWVIK